MANVPAFITTAPLDATGRPAVHDGAFRGRRLSWAEFYRLRPDLRPDNDNHTMAGGASEVSDGAGATPVRANRAHKSD